MLIKLIKSRKKPSLRKMAEALGINPNTARQRIKQLEKSGVIKGYDVLLDYEKLGYSLKVLMLMRVKVNDPALENEVEKLEEIPEIQELHAMTGVWDLVAIARVKNRDELLTLIKKVSSNPAISKIATSIVLTTYKNPNQFDLL